jgi:hypothetical protein
MEATTQLSDLERRVIEFNAKIDRAERAPDGDDYNRLFDLVTTFIRAPYIEPPKPESFEPTVYECEDPFGVGCEWTGTMEEINGIHHIRHIHERLEPGELVPAGCCPECNSVISVADRDVPHYTLHGVAQVMRQRGWSVAQPPNAPDIPESVTAKADTGEAYAHLAVVGRLSDEDEDSVVVYQQLTAPQAEFAFGRDLLADIQDERTTPDPHVNYVLASAAPITIVVQPV